jgi:hypothetical protein
MGVALEGGYLTTKRKLPPGTVEVNALTKRVSWKDSGSIG